MTEQTNAVRSLLDREARTRNGIVNATGRPLSPRAVRMLGVDCPGGWNSENGYNDHGCRCEGCRLAHRAARKGRYEAQRQTQAAS